VEDLHKTYFPSETVALRGVWFDVADGEAFGLLGPSRAGKSTTLGVLTTVIRPMRGRASVAGHDVRRDPLGVRSRIGVVFQRSVLDNRFSVLENLRVPARLWGLSRRDADGRIDELLAVLGLSDRAGDEVRLLNGGLRRRVELARALVGHPTVLFLDEPTVGLDPDARRSIWSSVARLRRDDGTTVVLATQHLEEARRACDRVAVVDRGAVVAQGPPDALADVFAEMTAPDRALDEALP
jgi:ABC-2 type transport system ATP-binding protein